MDKRNITFRQIRELSHRLIRQNAPIKFLFWSILFVLIILLNIFYNDGLAIYIGILISVIHIVLLIGSSFLLALLFVLFYTKGSKLIFSISSIVVVLLVWIIIRTVFVWAYSDPPFLTLGFSTALIILPGTILFLNRSATVITTEPDQSEKKYQTIFIQSGTRIHQIKIENILYIKAEGNYSRFFTMDEKILSLISLKETMQKLQDHQFIRVHRSYIVSLYHIKEIERHQVTIGIEKIPIGKSYYQNLDKAIKGINIEQGRGD